MKAALRPPLRRSWTRCSADAVNWPGLGKTVKWMGVIALLAGLAMTVAAREVTFDGIAQPGANPLAAAVVGKTLAAAAPKLIHAGAVAAMAGLAVQMNARPSPESGATGR